MRTFVNPRAALDGGLQRGVDVTRLDVFERQLADGGFDVFLDAAANDVRTLPLAQDHALEAFVSQLRHRHHGSGRLDLREGFGLALLLLARHIVAEGDIRAQFIGGLAGSGQRQVAVAAQVHDARLAGVAVAELPERRSGVLAPRQHKPIPNGATLESLTRSEFMGGIGCRETLLDVPHLIPVCGCPGPSGSRGQPEVQLDLARPCSQTACEEANPS